MLFLMGKAMIPGKRVQDQQKHLQRTVKSEYTGLLRDTTNSNLKTRAASDVEDTFIPVDLL